MTKDQFQIDLELQITNMESDLDQLKCDLQDHIENNCDHLFTGDHDSLGISCDNCGTSIADARNNGWPQ